MNVSLKRILKRTPVYRIYRALFSTPLVQLTPEAFAEWGEQDDRMLGFYRGFVKPGELVFDVGANVGKRSRVFLKLGARVVGFEPQNRCADLLQARFGDDPNFVLRRQALGESAGEAEMMISEEHTLSTLSDSWAQTTMKSGRFSSVEWHETQRVTISTLDHAIREFGVPVFMKIDVEGFEFQVLSGLSHPVPMISIEFAAEDLANTSRCLDHLASRWPTTLQFSEGESMTFDLPSWVDTAEMKRILAERVRQDPYVWGDVYIRCIPGTPQP